MSYCGHDEQSGGRYETVVAAKGDAAKQELVGEQNPDAALLDRRLMQRIYGSFHSVIAQAVERKNLPSSFLAALTANESSGRPDAACYEPAVYERLKAVATGQATSFGSIDWQSLRAVFQQNLEGWASGAQMGLSALELDDQIRGALSQIEERDLRGLATSWGLTQIMGYHVVGRKVGVHSLLDPVFHYRFAVELLGDFAGRFELDLGKDFDSLFRCWNTGHPDGRTYDPDYVPRGLRRMRVYEDVARASSSEEPARPK